MAAFLIIFAKPLITLFAGTDAEMQKIGALSICLQSIALPIHAWVAIVNMYCSGLGNAKGAFILATARQGTCFIPIVYPMALLWHANGIASVQAVADVLSLALAIPIMLSMVKKVKKAREEYLQETQAQA
jgi:Na+-driven multidrug efflux pump